jgi:hypothetical protein
MPQRELKRNVEWPPGSNTFYGPAYPERDVTKEVRDGLKDNPLVWTAPLRADAAGTPFGPRVAGTDAPGAEDPGASVSEPGLTRENLEKLDPAQLRDLLQARTGQEVSGNTSKKAMIDQLAVD